MVTTESEIEEMWYLCGEQRLFSQLRAAVGQHRKNSIHSYLSLTQKTPTPNIQ